MILVVSLSSAVVSLTPVCVQFRLANCFAVVRVAASVMHCASEFLQLFAEMDGCNSDVHIIIFSRRFEH